MQNDSSLVWCDKFNLLQGVGNMLRRREVRQASFNVNGTVIVWTPSSDFSDVDLEVKSFSACWFEGNKALTFNYPSVNHLLGLLLGQGLPWVGAPFKAVTWEEVGKRGIAILNTAWGLSMFNDGVCVNGEMDAFARTLTERKTRKVWVRDIE
jgi:hypothetical protein